MFVVDLAPNLVHQLAMGGDISMPLRKALEQRVLRTREANRFAGDFGPAMHRIEREPATSDNRGGLVVLSAPEKCANTSEEFSISERFREIVVRACVEDGDFFGFLAANGEDQDWALIKFANARDNS
jgi:hypothetical protein